MKIQDNQIESLAIAIFNYEIERGRQEMKPAYGMDPIRTEWVGMADDDKAYWRNRAEQFIEHAEFLGWRPPEEIVKAFEAGREDTRDNLNLFAVEGNFREQIAKEERHRIACQIIALLEKWDKEMPAGIDFIAANRGHLYPYIDLLKKRYLQELNK